MLPNDGTSDRNVRVMSKKENSSKAESIKNMRNLKYANITISKAQSIDSDVTVQQQYRSNAFIRSKSVLSNSNYSSPKNRASSVVSDLTVFEETPSLFMELGNTRASLTSTENIFSNRTIGLVHESTSRVHTSGSAPWPVTSWRKLRVNRMSRDVPVGSPDLHPAVYLHNVAHTTKDCLLHLLEKYNGRSSRNLGSVGRHQSISVGFGFSDNLEYRSIHWMHFFSDTHMKADLLTRFRREWKANKNDVSKYNVNITKFENKS